MALQEGQYYVPFQAATLELGNKMTAHQDERRVEVLFIPIQGYRHTQLIYYAYKGEKMSNLGMEKGFVNNQQQGSVTKQLRKDVNYINDHYQILKQ